MSGDHEGQSFEDRLAKARNSAGLDRPPAEAKPETSTDSSAMRLAMRLGVETVGVSTVSSIRDRG
jgi:hypothetical protein